MEHFLHCCISYTSLKKAELLEGNNIELTVAVRPNGEHNDVCRKRAEEVQRKIRSAKERLL